MKIVNFVEEVIAYPFVCIWYICRIVYFKFSIYVMKIENREEVI